MQKHHLHRHIRTSTIIAGIILLLLASGYFVLEYRTGQVVKLLVEKESNGQFHLDVDDVDLSFWKCKIELTNAVIQRIDTNTSVATSSIKLPQLYLQLSSWRALVFQNKLLIDSLYLVSPSYEVFADSSSENNRISFQTAQIFDGLKQTVEFLNVRSFRLNNGSFILHPYQSHVPFEIHGVNFYIRNFNRDSTHANRFLSADDIELDIPRQDLKINDGAQEVRFKQLKFSARKQSFQLDSCVFISSMSTDKSQLELRLDNVSFKADSLSSFYENDELILDTLWCRHPVLQLHTNGSQAATDTAADISESLRNFFINIHVKHIDIDSGQFAIESLKEGKTSSYTTQKTNLRVDNLSLRPGESPFLTIGNIDMQLKEVVFYTPDSLFQLTLEEFDLYNHEIHFKNTLFRPAANYHGQQSFSVAIPVLALHRLNLEDLLEERLGADVADMESPVITIESLGEKKKNTGATVNLRGFYEAMQGLSQLLRVKTLNVLHATVHYRAPMADSLSAELNDLNTSVSLNNFLHSTTLIDLKHAISYFQVAQINAQSKKLNAVVNDFHLHGTLQHNGIGSIHVILLNRTTVEAENCYWHKLDYDSLMKRKAIFLDSVNVGALSINATQISKRNGTTSENLPAISIRELSVEKIKMHYLIPGKSDIDAKGQNILLSQVSDSANAFRCSSASGNFSSLKYKSDGLTFSLKKLHFETPGETKVNDIDADISQPSATIHAIIPEMKFGTNITSTDFSGIKIPSLFINKPQIDFTQIKADSQESKPFRIPLDFSIEELDVNKGLVRYTSQNKVDTTTLSATLDASIKSFSMSKENPASSGFKNMDVSLSDLSFQKENVNATVPTLAIALSGGNIFDGQGRFVFQSFISGEWKDVSLQTKLKKGSLLGVTDFSGAIQPTQLELHPNEKFDWKKWIDRPIISGASIALDDSASHISLGIASWNPESQLVQIDTFSMYPNVKLRDYFNEAPWQSDYVYLKGDSAAISGVDFNKWFSDSILTAKKMDVQNFTVNVWRDKRIPFHHGTEKLMPTQLIRSIQTRFNFDSISVQGGNVYYHEFSNLTNREGTVPIENITAVIKKLRNEHQQKADTLSLKGTAQLLSCYISKFHYKEVYDDSLSSFKLTVKSWPTDLSSFSRMTNPLAAIDVSNGHCDTMVARVSGNKYASIGQMQFYYRDLKINLLNREDTLNKRFSLAFVNFVANSFVIKSSNQKRSTIFYVRDRERFIFNFWSKTILSGILTSAGIKSNGKYQKQYRKMKQEYILPEESF